MTSTPVETKGQKAAIVTDATWDDEAQASIVNQINQDQGKSLGTSLADVVATANASGTSGTSTTTGASSSNSVTSSSAASGDMPTGIDAIKAGGPQHASRNEKTQRYSQEH